MSHGLHAIIHTLCADGSGRDCNIFMDGPWRGGRQYGFGRVPAYHPIFSTGAKPVAYKFEPSSAPPLGGSESTEAQRRLGQSAPRIYRMPNNASLMFLPKEKKDANTLAKVASAGKLSDVGKTVASSSPQKSASAGNLPGWRSRETCSSFSSWSKKEPMAAQSKKTTRRPILAAPSK
mmetsp:Transcript_47553/g.75219  ORF Transcript_47553/g.75219 Transcript_47553/m.75219 type:complete len:177 (+) Transcript_47553:95-625(+)